jgi:CRP/FNR family transcriptional regulator
MFYKRRTEARMTEIMTRAEATVAARNVAKPNTDPQRLLTPHGEPPYASQRWRESLALIARHVLFSRRRLKAGQAVQLAGTRFSCLHIVNLGACKSVNHATDGREQVAGLHLRGDWIGFDCIAAAYCVCDVYAMDTSEVWSVPYVALLKAGASVPALMAAVQAAMSEQLARNRDWRLSLGTLSADARVADFLLSWALSLAERDLRHDQVTLRMTRAEIGSYLGLVLETVSRAFSALARRGLIRFDEIGRQTIAIPSVGALAEFARSEMDSPNRRTLQ